MTVATRPARARRSAPPPAATSSGRGIVWALFQGAALATLLFMLVFVLAQPAFRPRAITVAGNQHVTTAEISAALAIPADRSIFLIGHGDLEERLKTLPWVQSAKVALLLPDRISVSVTEWKPAAVLAVAENAFYLNEDGTVLAPAAEAGHLPLIDRSGLGPVQPGKAAVPGDLLRLLGPLQGGFPGAFHVRVLSFGLDAEDVLSLRTDRGWTVIFGQMDSVAQRASLDDKLGALRALSSRIDLATAPILYINLMNTRAPAVQMKR